MATIARLIFTDEEGRFWYARPARMQPNAVKAIISSMQDDDPSKFKRLPVSVFGDAIDGFSLVQGGDNVAFVKKIESINIDTHWLPMVAKDKDGKEFLRFDPLFCSDEKAPTFSVRAKVPVKINDLFFATIIDINGESVTGWQSYCFVAQSDGSKVVTYRLALPNMFDDSKVCLGDYNEVKGGSALEIAKSSFAIFDQSVFFNKDLYGKDKESMRSSFFANENLNGPADGSNPNAGVMRFASDRIARIMMAFFDIK